MKNFKTYFFVATILLAVSCAEREGATSPSEKYGELCMACCSVEMTQSKSSYPLSGDELNDVAVAMYDEEGLLTRSGYFPDLTDIRFKVPLGRTYSVYALFNTGEVSFPAAESEVPEIMRGWDRTEVLAKGGFPATWNGTVDFLDDGQTVRMAAERLIAKLIFKVDNSILSGHDGRFTVTSLALKNSPKFYFPFAEEGRTEGIKNFETDCSTESDIAALNNDSTAVFYTVENRRGTLLPDNIDPWKKVPENIPGEKDKCTYVEVSGTYGTNGGTMSAPVTYRLYIGSDAVTNFDVNRNEIYNVTLLPSDGGIGKASWKVTTGEILDTRRLTFGTDTLTMALNSSRTFTVTPYPSGMKYAVSGCETETAGLTVLPTGNTDEWEVSGSGSLQRDTLLYLAASSWDGRVTEQIPVKVTTRYPVKMKVNCDGYQSGSETSPVWKFDWYKIDGGGKATSRIPYTVSVTYSDGQTTDVTAKTEINNPADSIIAFRFNEGGTSFNLIKSGNDSPDVGGNGTVTFSYTEGGHTAKIDVKWYKIYVTNVSCGIDFAIWGTDEVLKQDGTKYKKCSIKYNDGSYSSSILEWSELLSSDKNVGTIVKSSDGKTISFHPKRYGVTRIYSTDASYRGVALGADVSVYRHGYISMSLLQYIAPPYDISQYSLKTFYAIGRDDDGFRSGGSLTSGAYTDVPQIVASELWEKYAVKGQYIIMKMYYNGDSETKIPDGESGGTIDIRLQQRPN